MFFPLKFLHFAKGAKIFRYWFTISSCAILAKCKSGLSSVPKQAMEALVNADWPGNIRELENFIERCVIFTQGRRIECSHAENCAAPLLVSASTFEQAERQVIIDALKAASGRIAGQRRSGRTARPETHHAPKQDVQAKHQSR